MQKIVERQANIAAELKILREIEKKNDSELLVDNLNLQKRIEYYQEMNEVLSKKLGLPPEEIYSDQGEDTPSVYNECISIDSDFDTNANMNDVGRNRQHIMSSSNIKDIMRGGEDSRNANIDLLLEAQRIKKKIMDQENGTDSNSNPLSDLQKNRKRVMEADSFAFVNLPQQTIDANSNPLTDLEKNRNRVMEADSFAFVNLPQPTIEVNSDPPTDLEKNRKKMMEGDTFAFVNLPQEKKTLTLDLTTERARNKKRVLESEFDIIPMSTTSDVSVIDKFANKVEETCETSQDSTSVKRLTSEDEIEKESLATEEDYFQDAEDGFSVADDVVSEIDLNGNCVTPPEAEAVSPSVYKTPTEIHQKKNPYERCELLIKTNFKCPPKHSVFRLQLDPEDKPIKVTSSKALNCLSVITLTEFLQKSIVSPMSTQLEIVRNEVLRVFLEEHQLLKHFKSLRNYFFLMDGEFGSHICDGILDKLQNQNYTPKELLNCATLHSILDNALSSSIGKDPNAQNLSFIILDTPEVFDLSSPSVLSNLTLCYSVSWPLNLIFTNETLDKYSFIFKHLIKVRRISWLLEDAYRDLKMQVKEHGREVLKSPEYRHVQLIRQKFSNFVLSLKNHITSTALQASWKFFKDNLMNANCLEDIYYVHTQYIKRIEFLCMLNKRSIEFHNTTESIFKICLRFCR